MWVRIPRRPSPHNHIPPIPPDPQPSRRHELLYRPGPRSLGHVQLQPEQGQIPPPDHAADSFAVWPAGVLAEKELDGAVRLETGVGALGSKPGQGIKRGRHGRQDS